MSSSIPRRPEADAVPGLLHDDDRTGGECIADSGEDVLQPGDDVPRSRVPQTHHDDSGTSSARQRHDFSEVEVERQHHPLLTSSERKDLGVGKVLEAKLANMNCIVPLLA